MNRAIVAVRPEPGLSHTLAAGRELGLPIVGAPLFEMEPIAWTVPDPAKYDALLIGSAMTFRMGGGRLRAFNRLPVRVVGQKTAEAAAQSGFKVAQAGEGGLQAVIDALPPGNHRLLRLGGEERVALKIPDEVSVEELAIYRANPLPLAKQLLDVLRESAIVLLHSAAAAQHFSSECKRLNIDGENLTLAVLGPRIAAAAGSGWNGVHSAETPSDAALLALAKELWL